MVEQRPAAGRRGSRADSGALDSIFGALADATRRDMLRRLAERQRTIGELAAPYDMSLAAASKHVRVLERAGLVRRTIQGRTHRCRLRPEPLAGAQAWLRVCERFWTDRLDALGALLQSDRTSTREREAR